MKPIKKEDLPKLILLIVLAVGVMGFALTQFLSTPGGTPTAAATTDTPGVPGAPGVPGVPGLPGAAGGPLAAGDGVPGALDAAATQPELDFLHIGPPTGGKDPFTPNGSAAPITPQPVAAATPAPSRPLPLVVANDSKRSNLQKLLGLTDVAGRGQDLEGEGAVRPLAPAAVELPAPSWIVTGIVLAERDSDGVKRGRDVAILRDSAGSRRFVTVGDPVDNDYHVSAVRLSGVEIRNGKSTVKTIPLSSLNSPERAGGMTVGGSGPNGVPSRAN